MRDQFSDGLVGTPHSTCKKYKKFRFDKTSQNVSIFFRPLKVRKFFSPPTFCPGTPGQVFFILEQGGGLKFYACSGGESRRRFPLPGRKFCPFPYHICINSSVLRMDRHWTAQSHDDCLLSCASIHDMKYSSAFIQASESLLYSITVFRIYH